MVRASACASSKGPVAQLGERIVRNDEVAGSIPARSTIYHAEASLSGNIGPATSRTRPLFRFAELSQSI